MEAIPYPWPYDGAVRPDHTALMLVAPQAAFAWMDPTGQVGNTIRRVVEATQHAGVAVVTVCLKRTAATGYPRIPLPEAGDSGAAWIQGLNPPLGSVVVEAPCFDAFYGTGLDALLWQRGLTHLVLAGFGTETAVHSTLRSANDRGFECLVLEDACADGDASLHGASMSSIMMSGGIFGAYGLADTFVAALSRHPQ